MKKVLLMLAIFAAALLAAPGVALAERGPVPGNGDRPGAQRMKRRPADGVRGILQPFAVKPSEEYKAELERHREVLKKIMQDLRELRLKIRESVKQEYQSELERLKNENPDAEKPPKPDIKEIVETVRKLYAEDIKAICTRIVDEDIKHSENLLAIKKKEREATIEKLGEIVGRGVQGARPGMNRPPRNRGNRGNWGNRPRGGNRGNQNNARGIR